MFIILLTYKKPLDQVDKYLPDHVNFLEAAYQNNYFLVSGRKNPRTGGVIISGLKDRKFLEEFLKRDPFYIHEIADYEVIEFAPTKYQKGFEKFFEY